MVQIKVFAPPPTLYVYLTQDITQPGFHVPSAVKTRSVQCKPTCSDVVLLMWILKSRWILTVNNHITVIVIITVHSYICLYFQPCLLKIYTPIQRTCILNYISRETYFPATSAHCEMVTVLTPEAIET